MGIMLSPGLAKEVWTADSPPEKLASIFDGSTLELYSGRPRRRIVMAPKARNVLLGSGVMRFKPTTKGMCGASIEQIHVRAVGRATYFRLVSSSGRVLAGSAGPSGTDLVLSDYYLTVGLGLVVEFDVALE